MQMCDQLPRSRMWPMVLLPWFTSAHLFVSKQHLDRMTSRKFPIEFYSKGPGLKTSSEVRNFSFFERKKKSKQKKKKKKSPDDFFFFFFFFLSSSSTASTPVFQQHPIHFSDEKKPHFLNFLFSRTTFWRRWDVHPNDTQHNEIQQKDTRRII
jgi:hypothetical protein